MGRFTRVVVLLLVLGYVSLASSELSFAYRIWPVYGISGIWVYGHDNKPKYGFVIEYKPRCCYLIRYNERLLTQPALVVDSKGFRIQHAKYKE